MQLWPWVWSCWWMLYRSCRWVGCFIINHRIGCKVAKAKICLPETSQCWWVAGEVVFLGTARPVEYYLNNYIATGDPHRELGNRVVLLKARNCAKPASAITAIRDATRGGLAQAKWLLEECIAGSRVELETLSGPAAEQLVKFLATIGIEAERR